MILKKTFFTIIEPKPMRNLPQINIILKGRATKALIDTGSTVNLISEEFANRNQLEKDLLKEKITVGGTGGISLIKEKCETNFSILEIPHTKFLSHSFVLENLPFDLILGTQFLTENEIIIDYKGWRASCSEDE